MNDKFFSLVKEILELEEFNLYIYYKYLSENDKNIILKVFSYILNKNKNNDDIFYKYFDAFFSIELEELKINDDTYTILAKKYGEARINDYFINLLDINNDSSNIKEKYKLIYSHIGDDEQAFFHDDAVRAYICSLSNKLLSSDEERECFTTMDKCRTVINIAFFDDIDNIIFYDFEKVICSISNMEQLKILNNIKNNFVASDKTKFENVYKKLKDYFKNHTSLRIENSDVYSCEYFNEQLLAIFRFYENRQLLIECNLKLVVSIAKKFRSTSLHLLDFIQEGNIGLMKAIKKFDVSMGNKLSTYATWWIKQTIQKCITGQEKIVRIPIHVEEKIHKINKATIILENKYGYTPSNEEIAEYLKISIDDVIFAKNSLRTSSIISLSASVGDEEDDSSLEEFIAADNSDVFDVTASNELHEICMEALDTLTDKEKFVIIHRFGINQNGTKTLDEVGKMIGVTRERIRQIEDKAIRKLRHPSRRKFFDGYY